MKTPEELNALRNEYEELKLKLSVLTEEELKNTFGGADAFSPCNECLKLHYDCEKCPYYPFKP